MTHHHLRLVHDDPPDLDDGDGGGDDGEEMILVEALINGTDGVLHGARLIIPSDATPEEIAYHLLMALRGVVATYNVDVQLALERRLLHWGDASER